MGRPRATAPAARSSGLRSMMTASRSVPETPSTSAWCVLARIAHRPSSSPSTTQISHNGLERSSCCAMTRPTSLRRSLSPPGDGQRRVAQVVLDVEVRVVDPDRTSRARRGRSAPSGGSAGRGRAWRPPWRRCRRTAAAVPRRWRPRRCACATRDPRCGGTRRPAGSGDQDSSALPSAAPPARRLLPGRPRAFRGQPACRGGEQARPVRRGRGWRGCAGGSPRRPPRSPGGPGPRPWRAAPWHAVTRPRAPG